MRITGPARKVSKCLPEFLWATTAASSCREKPFRLMIAPRLSLTATTVAPLCTMSLAMFFPAFPRPSMDTVIPSRGFVFAVSFFSRISIAIMAP